MICIINYHLSHPKKRTNQGTCNKFVCILKLRKCTILKLKQDLNFFGNRHRLYANAVASGDCYKLADNKLTSTWNQFFFSDCINFKRYEISFNRYRRFDCCRAAVIALLNRTQIYHSLTFTAFYHFDAMTL